MDRLEMIATEVRSRYLPALPLSMLLSSLPPCQGPLRSPPETDLLGFSLPTAAEFKRTLPKPGRGAEPNLMRESKKDGRDIARAAWEDLCLRAAFHPLKDWTFTESVNDIGYQKAVWGHREYVLVEGGRAFRVEEELEEGYDGHIASAACVLVMDQLTSDPRFQGSRLRLYANDEWGVFPLKILEERFALANRQLSRRQLFTEAVFPADAWTTIRPRVQKATQPAPLTLDLPTPTLPDDFGAGWKGHGPADARERAAYRGILQLAANADLAAWKFTEEIADGFGKRAGLWGTRRFEFRDGEQACVIEEQVHHSGTQLRPRCNLAFQIGKGGTEPPLQLQLTGGWAELPYQYLERRVQHSQGILPTRLPYVALANDPGSFVK